MALALALWLAGAPDAADGGAAESKDGSRDAGAESHLVRPERSDGGAGAESKGAPDDELIRHLDELRSLELLENLELFDPEPERAPTRD